MKKAVALRSILLVTPGSRGTDGFGGVCRDEKWSNRARRRFYRQKNMGQASRRRMENILINRGKEIHLEVIMVWAEKSSGEKRGFGV